MAGERPVALAHRPQAVLRLEAEKRSRPLDVGERDGGIARAARDDLVGQFQPGNITVDLQHFQHAVPGSRAVCGCLYFDDS